jgi:hypothetical protein
MKNKMRFCRRRSQHTALASPHDSIIGADILFDSNEIEKSKKTLKFCCAHCEPFCVINSENWGRLDLLHSDIEKFYVSISSERLHSGLGLQRRRSLTEKFRSLECRWFRYWWKAMPTRLKIENPFHRNNFPNIFSVLTVNEMLPPGAQIVKIFVEGNVDETENRKFFSQHFFGSDSE